MMSTEFGTEYLLYDVSKLLHYVQCQHLPHCDLNLILRSNLICWFVAL